MRRFKTFWIVCGLASLLTGLARAETYQLNDGTTLTGEPVSFDDRGLIVRQADGKYSDRAPWAKFSQEDLKQFAANPKATRYVQRFIELPPEQKAKRDEIPLKPVPRLNPPAAGSLWKALFSSSAGLAILFVLYLANIYAGYEIAIFREQPKALGCGLAAVVPVMGPILLFFLPARLKREEEKEPSPSAEPQGAPPRQPLPRSKPPEPPAEAAPERPATRLTLAPREEPETPVIPDTKVFTRGEFMFNRRFFETKFPGFFGVVRREADRDMVLIIKAARGLHVAQRITRISANDLHVEEATGAASQEVMIPFVEVSEVTLKHKSAR